MSSRRMPCASAVRDISRGAVERCDWTTTYAMHPPSSTTTDHSNNPRRTRDFGNRKGQPFMATGAVLRLALGVLGVCAATQREPGSVE
jgi:hypothetical protein